MSGEMRAWDDARTSSAEARGSQRRIASPAANVTGKPWPDGAEPRFPQHFAGLDVKGAMAI